MNHQLMVLLSLCFLAPVAMAATCRSDSSSKRVIGAAKESSYRDIRDGRYWPNPEVFVEEAGIYVRLPENGLERRNLSIEQTMVLLNQQDCAIWPYGAVVMLSYASITSPTADHSAMQQMLLNLKKALEKEGFKADLWPSG